MRRIMTTTVPPVKPLRNTTRRPGRFGAGLIASRPTTPAPFTFSDSQWWAAEQASAEDRHYDRLADEAAFMDRYDRGLSC